MGIILVNNQPHWSAIQQAEWVFEDEDTGLLSPQAAESCQLALRRGPHHWTAQL